MNKRKHGEVDIKIVLLGKAYAGKTCLVQRYINQIFTDMPYQNVSFENILQSLGYQTSKTQILTFGKSLKDLREKTLDI